MTTESLKTQGRFLKRNFPVVWKTIQAMPPRKRVWSIRRNYRRYAGLGDDSLPVSAVSRRLGIPVRTLHDWIRRKMVPVTNTYPCRVPAEHLGKVAALYGRIRQARASIRKLMASGLTRGSAHVRRSREAKIGRQTGGTGDAEAAELTGETDNGHRCRTS